MDPNTSFQSDDKKPIKPEKAQKILKEHGLEVTLDQAKAIVEFLNNPANIALSVYIYDKKDPPDP